MTGTATLPKRTLSVSDAVAIIVGIVVGAGIFRAPSIVAANSGSDIAMLLLWLAGGAIALVGALCYAELASTWPHTGGDYHYLGRAFGRGPAFLFAWARLSVMQTGSIALLAFVFGDYAAELLPVGRYSVALYAAFAVVVFTGINLLGIRETRGTQRLFTLLQVIGVVAIAFVGLVAAAAGLVPEGPSAVRPEPVSGSAALGLAMVFVLLTYGGWNEAAFVSSEVGGARAPIARALLMSIAVITAIYLLINLAYLSVLGRAGMAQSDAVAADAMRLVLGDGGARFVALLVGVCALTSINATIITGARCTHALGRDFPLFRFLGRWDGRVQAPRNALMVQAAIVLVLIGFGAGTRSGFATVVEFTAPVFWLFFLLTGVALFRLRRLERDAPRPFRVPLYPLTPLLFCLSSALMLWSSVRYTGAGALVGIAVLLAGLPVLWFLNRRQTDPSTGEIMHEYQ